MGLPLPLLNRRRRGGFSPFMLFANGEEGALFDGTQIVTLFQDTSGASPVTTPAQSIAEAVDLSGNGNNAEQATAGSRPLYGIAPSGGIRNGLTYTEQFDNAAWSKIALGAGSVPVVTANAGVDPNGLMTADRVVFTLPGSPVIGDISTLSQTFVYPAGSHTFSLWVKSNTGSSQAFILLNENIQSSVQTATTSWQRFSFARTATGSNSSCGIRIRGTQTGSSADLLIWGAQLEAAAAASSYQSAVTRSEIREEGVSSVGVFFNDSGTKSLPWSAPADTYTIAFSDHTGAVTIETGQVLSGATAVLRATRTKRYIAVNRALTTAETAGLTAYLQG